MSRSQWSTELRALAQGVAQAIGIEPAGAPRPDLDWRMLAVLARRHRVTALLARSELVGDAPEDVGSAVRRRTHRQALRALDQRALQRELVDELHHAGIGTLVVKGLPLAQEAYGNVTTREARDLDIVVAVDDAERAGEAIIGLGLDLASLPPRVAPHGAAQMLRDAARLPATADIAFAGRGHAVELHWRLTRNSRLLPFDPAWLAQPDHVAIGDLSVPVLPMPQRWWQLFAHGAGHDWRRLRWLADVAALSRRQPELVSPFALERSRQAGLERCVASGLLVAEAALGSFLPAESRAWVTGVRGCSPHVRRALAALADPRDAGSGPGVRGAPSFVASRLRLRTDVPYRLEEARRLALTSGGRFGEPDPGLTGTAAAALRWSQRKTRHALRRQAPSGVLPAEHSSVSANETD